MDYQQSNVSGVRWRRFGNVSISNPLGGSPTVSCAEQEVVALGDREIAYGVGNLDFPFDPDFSFEVLNPVTNEPTGSMASGATVYALVYSYVLAKAKERDAAAAAAVDNMAQALALSAAHLPQGSAP